MLWTLTLLHCLHAMLHSLCTYFVICLLDRAMAYSATTVLPADVWAATNTLQWSSNFNIACKTAQPFRNKARVRHQQQELKFFHHCGWGSTSSRIWHYVIGQVAPNTLKYLIRVILMLNHWRWRGHNISKHWVTTDPMTQSHITEDLNAHVSRNFAHIIIFSQPYFSHLYIFPHSEKSKP